MNKADTEYRKDIIAMAQEAGWDAHHAEFDTRFQIFAALVIKSLKPSLQIEFEKMFMEGAAAEREACAKFIEHDYVRQFERPWRVDLSAAIRARGDNK
jgi:hypothetical protein